MTSSVDRRPDRAPIAGGQHRHGLPADTAVRGSGRTRLAVSATLHCLTGCAIGEVLGLVLATWWGWSNPPSIALAVVLAFVFGYSFTLAPVLRSGLPLRRAVGVALAADTLSILTMEVVDNGVVLAVPGPWTPASPRSCSGAAWRSLWSSPLWSPSRSTGR